MVKTPSRVAVAGAFDDPIPDSFTIDDALFLELAAKQADQARRKAEIDELNAAWALS